MTEYVSKSAFKAKALEYFRRVEETGVAIVITDRGMPALELRPFRVAESPSALERLRGSMLRLDDPTEPVGVEDWDGLA
jgi:antitoxin (DNA-binding transcriptional repressor) of toxin-antitoxin stability system